MASMPFVATDVEENGTRLEKGTKMPLPTIPNGTKVPEQFMPRHRAISARKRLDRTQVDKDREADRLPVAIRHEPIPVADPDARRIGTKTVPRQLKFLPQCRDLACHPCQPIRRLSHG